MANLVSVQNGRAIVSIEGKEYPCTKIKTKDGYGVYGLPKGGTNLANVLVKVGTKNVKASELSFERNTSNFAKFTVGEPFKSVVSASVYTPKIRDGKANRTVGKANGKAVVKTGKKNLVMAEILKTQQHLAELIASIS